MGLKISTTIVFEQLLKSDELNKRIVVAQGGSRSGKTFNILVYWIYRLLQEEKKTLTIVRKTLPSLKNSVLKDLIQVLEMFEVYDPNKMHKQEGWYELGCYLFKTTWRDNPFVSDTIIKELESLREKDENLYRIYNLGEKGIATQLVFTKFNTIEQIPNMKLLGRGMDFGYNSPTTLIEVYKDEDNLYFRELLYTKNKTMPDIIYQMEQLGFEKTDTIWCDSALPQNIEELKRARFNVKPVNKKSILHGIDLIKRHHIFIEQSSTNTIREFQSYKFKEDKDGQLLDVPEDDHNHAIDAIRYVLESELNKKSGTLKIL